MCSTQLLTYMMSYNELSIDYNLLDDINKHATYKSI